MKLSMNSNHLGKKQLIQFIICVTTYLYFGNFLVEDGQETSNSDSIMAFIKEHGGMYIFMITAAVYLSLFRMDMIEFHAPKYVMLFFDTLGTMFLTNIALKFIWMQVENCVQLTCGGLSELLVLIAGVNPVSIWLDTSYKWFALLIAFGLFIFVLNSLCLFHDVICKLIQLSSLFKKSAVVSSPRPTHSQRGRPKGRANQRCSPQRRRLPTRFRDIYRISDSEGELM